MKARHMALKMKSENIISKILSLVKLYHHKLKTNVMIIMLKNRAHTSKIYPRATLTMSVYEAPEGIMYT